MYCPNCGGQNPDDAKFCQVCGKPLANEQQQSATPAQPYQPVQTQQPAQAVQTEQNKGGWKKWVLLAGSICGALAVLFSFIFTFLIGVSAYPADVGGILGGIGGERTEYGIAYFFGGSFEDMIHMFENMDSLNISQIIYTLFTTLFGSLIFIGFIIAMLVVFIKAIIRYVKHFKGTDEKGITKLTTGAFFFYALGASLISSLFAWNENASGMGISQSAGIGYNAATTAGLALGGIFLGAFIITRIAVFGKELINFPKRTSDILTLCTVIFSAVVWSLAAGGLFGFGESEFGSSMNMSTGFLPAMQGLHLDDEKTMTVLGLCVCGWAFTVVLLTIISKLTTLNVRKLESLDNKNSGLALAITQLVFSTLILVMGIVLTTEDYMVTIFGSGKDAYLAPAAVLFVMSVIVLGLTIANKIVTKKFANLPEPVNYSTVETVETVEEIPAPVENNPEV